MSQLAALGSKLIVDNGREKRTDGLFKHLGLADVASFRVTGYDPPRSGAGTELIYYSPTKSGVLQVYDRDAQQYGALNINASVITLSPTLPGRIDMPTGTVNSLIGQYAQGSNFSTTSTSFVETDMHVQGTFTGKPIRIEWSVTFSNSAAGGGSQIALGWDGVAQWPLFYTLCPAGSPGYWQHAGGAIYHNQGMTGVHRFALFAAGSGSCTITFLSWSYNVLAITEQRG